MENILSSECIRKPKVFQRTYQSEYTRALFGNVQCGAVLKWALWVKYIYISPYSGSLFRALEGPTATVCNIGLFSDF